MEALSLQLQQKPLYFQTDRVREQKQSKQSMNREIHRQTKMNTKNTQLQASR